MNTLLYISLQFPPFPSASLRYEHEEIALDLLFRSGRARYFIFQQIPSISCYPSCRPCP
jgi:hypothetical protein